MSSIMKMYVQSQLDFVNNKMKAIEKEAEYSRVLSDDIEVYNDEIFWEKRRPYPLDIRYISDAFSKLINVEEVSYIGYRYMYLKYLKEAYELLMKELDK